MSPTFQISERRTVSCSQAVTAAVVLHSSSWYRNTAKLDGGAMAVRLPDLADECRATGGGTADNGDNSSSSSTGVDFGPRSGAWKSSLQLDVLVSGSTNLTHNRCEGAGGALFVSLSPAARRTAVLVDLGSDSRLQDNVAGEDPDPQEDTGGSPRSSLGGRGGGLCVLAPSPARWTAQDTSCHLRADNLTARNNRAAMEGGALSVSACNVSLFGVAFEGNTVKEGGGGALALSWSSSLELTASKLSGNSALYGGALHVTSGASALVIGAALHNNTAAQGPGGAVFASRCAALDLRASIVTSNQLLSAAPRSVSSGGGGVAVDGCAAVFLSAVQLYGNSARGSRGGSLLVMAVGSLAVADCVVADSVAATGGGAYLDSVSAVVINTTWRGNSALEYSAVGPAPDGLRRRLQLQGTGHTAWRGRNAVAHAAAGQRGGSGAHGRMGRRRLLQGNGGAWGIGSYASNGGGLFLGRTAAVLLRGNTFAANNTAASGPAVASLQACAGGVSDTWNGAT